MNTVYNASAGTGKTYQVTKYYIDQVIKNKSFKKDIIDKKRISKILKNINRKSKIKKIDTNVTKKIWKSMIKAFIDYEFRNFKKK